MVFKRFPALLTMLALVGLSAWASPPASNPSRRFRHTRRYHQGQASRRRSRVHRGSFAGQLSDQGAIRSDAQRSGKGRSRSRRGGSRADRTRRRVERLCLQRGRWTNPSGGLQIQARRRCDHHHRHRRPGALLRFEDAYRDSPRLPLILPIAVPDRHLFSGIDRLPSYVALTSACPRPCCVLPAAREAATC